MRTFSDNNLDTHRLRLEDWRMVFEHPLNEGMSGGPAFDENGDLVGIQVGSVVKESACVGRCATWAASVAVHLPSIRDEVAALVGHEVQPV